MIDYQKKFRLDNKMVFVAGGFGLIGKEATYSLASAGGKIIVLDNDIKKEKHFLLEAKREKKQIQYEYFDCSDLENIEANYSKVISKYGAPDVFVNCAYPRTSDWTNSSFSEITFKSFRENIDIHLHSQGWLAKLSADEMVQNEKQGSIIQLGSIYGVVGQDLNIYEGTNMREGVSYSVIKGGITNLTRLMASYYGQYDVRINTLCPGGLEGPVAGGTKEQSPTFIENYSRKVPLKRLGKAEEVATVVLFLASEAASYVTGATIMVDGGWTAI